MAWTDRIREAAYTSPKGTRLTFDFEDVSREVTKQTTAFEFPGVKDAYVQDNGFGARRYPLRCFFSGSDHDIAAARFEAALLEQGVGRLEHPFYGLVKVTPMGDITRRDDLKSAANQTVIEVTFWTTTGLPYPQATGDPKSEIQAALDAFDASAASQFAAKMDLRKAIHRAGALAGVQKLLRSVGDGFDGISEATLAVNREFRDIQRTVNLGIDVLIGKPLLLAQQISNLIKAPGRALAGIQDRLSAYRALADSIFGSSGGNPGNYIGTGPVIADRVTRLANNFHISDLGAMNALGGSVTSVLNTTFGTKPAALDAANKLSVLLADTITWRDAGFKAIATPTTIAPYQNDVGDSFRELQQTVALTVGFLVEVSFTLVPERRIVLDRERTIVDLAAELYGSVDDRLDFLIDSNNLNGDEILELPRGRSILYYPA